MSSIENKKMLLGIGNKLRTDDGVGPYVASSISSPGWTTIDCGPAPGNFTSKVKANSPQLLVLVDAAKMGLEPGEYRKLPVNRAERMVVSTHHIPLTSLLAYLEKYVEGSLLIGVEPQKLETGEGLTPAVHEGAEELISILESEGWDQISNLCPK